MDVLHEARERIAAEIRAEMARQRKLQTELGEVLNLPQQSISRRLQGKTAFRVEELAALAAWLNVPADQFTATAANRVAGAA